MLSVSGPYSKSYTYDPIGNIQTNSGTTYTYGDTNHKHAVTGLNTGESYTYDANGNMITRVENGQTYNQTFDIENRLASVTVNGQTAQFIYDGDGNLVKTIKPDGSKTLYIAGLYEVDKTSGGSVTRTVTYYPVSGAMRINSTLYYLLKDHLGSASVVTDGSGTIVGEDRFYPYGETRFTTGSMNTDKLYTGQREMTGLGIYHYGARFYSPKLGRFLSPDTIVQSYGNPQTLNRYSYVLGNPLRYTDPTGHTVACDPYEGDCKQDDPEPSPTPDNGNDPNDPTDDADDPNPDCVGCSSTGSAEQSSYFLSGTNSQSYCGGGPNGWYNFFDCAANITQDWALAIDTPFAFLDVVLITAGCFAGPEGCAAGAGITDTIFNITGANLDETILSSVSAAFSVAADFSDDGQLGQSSAVSVVAAVGGFFSPDPLLDFAIDGIGAAYNHEVHPIYDLFSH